MLLEISAVNCTFEEEKKWTFVPKPALQRLLF